MEIKAIDIIVLLLRLSLFLFGVVFSALAGLYKTMLRHSYHIGELRGLNDLHEMKKELLNE